jgi:hypothetical protein
LGSTLIRDLDHRAQNLLNDPLSLIFILGEDLHHLYSASVPTPEALLTPRKHPSASILRLFITAPCPPVLSFANALPFFAPESPSTTNKGAIARYTVCMTRPSEKVISGRVVKVVSRDRDEIRDCEIAERSGLINSGERDFFLVFVSRVSDDNRCLRYLEDISISRSATTSGPAQKSTYYRATSPQCLAGPLLTFHPSADRPPWLTCLQIAANGISG